MGAGRLEDAGGRGGFVGMESACLELIQSRCGRHDGGLGSWVGWGAGWQWRAWPEKGRNNGEAW